MSVGAHVGQYFFHRADHRAHGNHDGLGVRAFEFLDQAAGITTEDFLELSRLLRNGFERIELFLVSQETHFGKGFGADHRAHRQWISRIQHLAWFEGRQKSIDLRLFGNIDLRVGMRQYESVHAHHDRQAELLGEFERLDMHIDRLLVALDKELQPPGIAR